MEEAFRGSEKLQFGSKRVYIYELKHPLMPNVRKELNLGHEAFIVVESLP